MSLSIYYAPRRKNINALISVEDGIVYWKALDICAVLGYKKTGSVLKIRLYDEKLKRYSDIEKSTHSQIIFLTLEQVIKFCSRIPPSRRMQEFEDWLTALNNGDQKVYPEDPIQLQIMLNNASFRNHARLKTEANSSDPEWTIPCIVSEKQLKSVPFKEKILTKCHSEDDIETMDSMDSFEKPQWKDKVIVNDNKSFRLEYMGEKYNFVCFKLNWKTTDVRPMNIYPFLEFDGDEGFFYVPIKEIEENDDVNRSQKN